MALYFTTIHYNNLVKICMAIKVVAISSLD